MLNKFLVLPLVALLAACSSSPPKVGSDVIVENKPVLSNSSSEALKDIASLGALGVRDLTVKEFQSVRSDADRFGKIASTRKGVGAGYHVGTGALALLGGMSLGDVLGVGLASAMFTDSRPDNYDFAKDFSSTSRAFSLGGVDRDVLLNAKKSSIEAMMPEILKALSLNSSYEIEHFSNASSGLEGYRAKAGNLVVAYFLNCTDAPKSCRSSVAMYRAGNGAVLENALILDMASRLPESYLLYMAPNRSVYRLPMIVSGGSAEVRYLVEKDSN